MHPLLRIATSQPQLLVDHAAAYAELVSAEVGVVSTGLKRQALLSALALGCMGVAVVLAGVALMLWAALPPTQMQAPWALVATPLLPLAIALACLLAARARTPGRAFDKLRRQLAADRAMLRDVSAA